MAASVVVWDKKYMADFIEEIGHCLYGSPARTRNITQSDFSNGAGHDPMPIHIWRLLNFFTYIFHSAGDAI
jgi:hypothetical protein